MNFPGLDPAWAGTHRGGQQLGLICPWTLARCRAALPKGARVLVVASTALGDSLLTTPLVETLSNALGPDRVSLLVREPIAELYRNDPRLGHVFTVRGKNRVGALCRALPRVPHRLALLANITEPDLIPWLWWCGVRGFLRYRSRWTRYPKWIANTADLRSPDQPDYATGHAIENNLAMADALEIPATTHRLNLPHLRRKSDKIVPSNVVLLHPGASRANKIWPVENWVRVADQLNRKFAARVQITGSSAELPLAEAIRAAVAQPDLVDIVAGKLSLMQLAQAQRDALLFLSGDTGPYHLAVAVGCPTYTLFAPTDRGSSTEACGPHQADPARHRYLETAQPGDSISTLPVEKVIAEVEKLVHDLLA